MSKPETKTGSGYQWGWVPTNISHNSNNQEFKKKMLSIENKVGPSRSFKDHMTCDCKPCTAYIEGSRMHSLWVGRKFHP